MKHPLNLIILLAMVVVSTSGYSQATCTASALSDQQIKDIIDRAKVTREDLPEPFPEYKWVVRRQGCYYVYIEYGLPLTPEYNQIFKLNQYGIIVDVQAGDQSISMECPDKKFSENELAEIIKQAREKRQDLPSEFPNFQIRVNQLRCMYFFFEYAVPKVRGKFQVFVIDPFGELMEFSRSQPY